MARSSLWGFHAPQGSHPQLHRLMGPSNGAECQGEGRNILPCLQLGRKGQQPPVLISWTPSEEGHLQRVHLTSPILTGSPCIRATALGTPHGSRDTGSDIPSAHFCHLGQVTQRRSLPFPQGPRGKPGHRAMPTCPSPTHLTSSGQSLRTPRQDSVRKKPKEGFL